MVNTPGADGSAMVSAEGRLSMLTRMEESSSWPRWLRTEDVMTS